LTQLRLHGTEPPGPIAIFQPRLPSLMSRVFRPEVLVALFTVQMASGFIVRPTPTWALVFYAGFLPLTLWAIWQHRHGRWFRDPALLTAIAMISWFSATVFWAVDQPTERGVKFFVGGVMNAVFVIGGVFAFAVATEDARERFYRAIGFAAPVNAIIAMVHNYLLKDEPAARLTGWAETRHEVLGANIMAIAAMITVRNLACAPSTRWRLVWGTALLLELTFIFLTGSRGAWLACAAGIGIFLVATTWRVTAAAAVAAAAALVAALSIPAAREFVVTNLARHPYRLEIWSETISRWQEHPFAGWGVGNDATFVIDQITFPHSLYFSALYYGGVIGLGLLLATYGMAIQRAVSTTAGVTRTMVLALLAVSMTAGLTDIGQPIRAPSEEWYIIWLPIILAVGLSIPVSCLAGRTVSCSKDGAHSAASLPQPSEK